MDITFFTVQLLLAVHLGLLVLLTANAGEACKFTFTISWKLDICGPIEFTCWDWMLDLYQSMDRTFFTGDGPVNIDESLGKVNVAVASSLLPTTPQNLFLGFLVPVFSHIVERSLDISYGVNKCLCRIGWVNKLKVSR